jgi:hypothetical protein
MRGWIARVAMVVVMSAATTAAAQTPSVIVEGDPPPPPGPIKCKRGEPINVIDRWGDRVSFRCEDLESAFQRGYRQVTDEDEQRFMAEAIEAGKQEREARRVSDRNQTVLVVAGILVFIVGGGVLTERARKKRQALGRLEERGKEE